METRRLPSSRPPPYPPGESVFTRLQEGPGTVIGNYKLLQEIGEGGFGVVYMAEQFQPVKRKVALKIIKPGMDSREIIARFEAERQALALMLHPNIAQVLDAGSTESGRPYFVMELVKGTPITEFCDQNKFPTVERLGLFIDICGAIQHAHQKGIIHRDIKPSNLLVTLHDGVPVPKVIDFGIAKALNQELTQKTLFTAYGQMLGTPQYTSPEQAEMSGLDIDTRSDIYSLGVLLYELLTGETPISRRELTSANLMEMQKLIREKEATKPSMAVNLLCRESTTVADFRKTEPAQLCNEIRGDLDWIVLKALDKDRTRRYGTANGFAQDIRRYLNNEPVSASPPTMGYLLGKFARRNRRLITAASAVFTALLLGAIGMTFLYLRASADRQDAVTARQTAEQKTAAAERAQVAEAEARLLAQRNEERIKQTLARADLVSGVDLLARGDDRQALARLARSLRTDPNFLPAAQVLVSALRDRNFDLDPEIVLRHQAPITSFALNRAGDLLLTHAQDGTLRLWDTETFSPSREALVSGGAKSASFTPDGEHLVTLASNGVAQVLNVRSLKPEGSPMAPEGGVIEFKSAARSDGALVVATRSGHGSLQVWDGRSGRPLTPPLRPETELHAVDFRFNEDGTRLLGQFGNRWSAIWEIPGGRLIHAPNSLPGVGYRVVSMSRGVGCNVFTNKNTLVFRELTSGERIAKLSFDERVVSQPILNHDASRAIFQFRALERPRRGSPAGFGTDLTTRIVDFPSGQVIHEFVDRDAPGLPVIHSASGYSLLKLNDFTVRIRDVKAGTIVKDLEPGHRLATSASDADILVFSPSGDRFVVQLADGRLEIYAAHNGRLQASCEAQSAPFTDIRFSPEGQRLATATAGGERRIWDIVTGEALTPPFQHAIQPGRAVFTHDGRRIVSSDLSRRGGRINHGVLHVWKVAERRAIDEFLPLPPLRNHPCDISRRNRLAVATRSGEILILDVPTRAVVRELSLKGTAFLRASLSPQDDRVVALSGNGAFVWELDSPEPAFRLASEGTLFSAHFSRDGTQLVTASTSNSVRVWDSFTGEPLTPPLSTGAKVRQIRIDPEATRLLAATFDAVFVWDLAAADPKASRKRISREANKSSRADFSPDGKKVISISLNEAEVWDVETGEEVGSFIHTFNLTTARFAPDGNRVLVTGPSVGSQAPVPGLAVLWDLASRKRQRELPHPDQVRFARMSPDGAFVVTLARDDILRVWDAATGQLVSETAKPYTPFRTFRITPDGRTLVYFSDGRIWLRPMPRSHRAIPTWLPGLAEAVAGRRLDHQGNLETVPRQQLQALRGQLGQLEGNDDYSRFARWFVADNSRRTLSPESIKTRSDLIQRLQSQSRPNSVRRALRLDPANPKLHAEVAAKYSRTGLRRLRDARNLGRPGPAEAIHWQSPSEWYALQGIRLAPHSPEAWIAYAAILDRRGNTAASLEVTEQMRKLRPHHPDVAYLRAFALGKNGDLDAAYREFKPSLRKLLNDPGNLQTSVANLRILIDDLAPLEASDPRHWSELAVQLAPRAWPGNAITFHADWLSRMALETAPGDHLVAVRRASVLRMTRRVGEADALIEKTVRKLPGSSEGWFVKAQILADLKRFEEALQAVNTSLEESASDPDQSRRKLRLKLLSRLGRTAEARTLFLDLDIPDRSTEATPGQIDLSAHYNASLNEGWMPPTQWNGTRLTLSSLPAGLTEMDGILFDARGLIQARGPLETTAPRQAGNFPAQVTIPATGKWRTLHFLHGASGAFDLEKDDPRRIGHYQVHFADGRTLEIPIVLGQDLWHWVQSRGSPAKTTRARIAWSHDLGEITLRIFHCAWVNPWPEAEVSHIDLVSDGHPRQHPFLIALTGQ